MLMAVYDHSVVRTEVEPKQRPIPVGHLREEEMRWEASSKPGETAQEG